MNISLGGYFRYGSVGGGKDFWLPDAIKNLFPYSGNFPPQSNPPGGIYIDFDIDLDRARALIGGEQNLTINEEFEATVGPLYGNTKYTFSMPNGTGASIYAYPRVGAGNVIDAIPASEGYELTFNYAITYNEGTSSISRNSVIAQLKGTEKFFTNVIQGSHYYNYIGVTQLENSKREREPFSCSLGPRSSVKIANCVTPIIIRLYLLGVTQLENSKREREPFSCSLGPRSSVKIANCVTPICIHCERRTSIGNKNLFGMWRMGRYFVSIHG